MSLSDIQYEVEELVKKARQLDKMGLEDQAGKLAKQIRKGLEDLEDEIGSLETE